MRNRDDGLTVIELLVAMMILFLIMAPLATSFVLGLNVTRASEQDAANSADAQLLAGFFDIDVASAETVATSSACGGTGTVLELRWTDGTAPTFVAYRAIADAARQAELNLTTAVYNLERVTCAAAAGPVDETQIVARTLASPPTVACDVGGSCSSTPRRITMSAEAYSTQFSDTLSTTRFTFGVTAARRVRP